MEPVSRRVTDTMEKLVARMEQLENKHNMGKEDISRLLITLERMMNGLAEFENHQEINKELARKLDRLTEQIEKLFSQQQGGLADRDHEHLIENIKYYVIIAKVVGQVIEIIANSTILILDTVSSATGDGSNKNSTADSRTAGSSSSADVDLSGILQSINEVIRGLTGTLSAGGKTGVDNKDG